MDDPVYVGWDLENSGVNKPKEFVEYLKNEISKAFPGKRIEIHVFVVKDEKGTVIMQKYCSSVLEIKASPVTFWKKNKEKEKKEKKKRPGGLQADLRNVHLRYAIPSFTTYRVLIRFFN